MRGPNTPFSRRQPLRFRNTPDRPATPMYPLLPVPVDETASVPLRRVNWDATDLTTRNATTRHVGQRHAAPPHTAMSLARTLNAERPYLHLVTRDEIAAAVEALDEQLDRRSDETAKFIDPYRRGRVSWVHRLVGNEEIIIIMPLRCDSSAVQSAVDVLVDTALGELGPHEL